MQTRTPAGVPAGGQYASHDRPDSAVGLADARTHDDTGAWLRRNGLRLESEPFREMVDRLATLHRPINDIDRADIFRQVFRDSNGYELDDETRLASAAAFLREQGRDAEADSVERIFDSLRNRAVAAERRHPTIVIDESEVVGELAPHAVRATDPRVQAGTVFDAVQSGDRLFHRRRADVCALEPTAVRIQANRALDDDEVQNVRDLLAYGLSSSVRPDAIGQPERDSDYSFIVELGQGNWDAAGRFEDGVPQLLAEGSPVRTTDRSGPGTSGTRAVEGLGHGHPLVEIYYDSVLWL